MLKALRDFRSNHHKFTVLRTAEGDIILFNPFDEKARAILQNRIYKKLALKLVNDLHADRPAGLIFLLPLYEVELVVKKFGIDTRCYVKPCIPSK